MRVALLVVGLLVGVVAIGLLLPGPIESRPFHPGPMPPLAGARAVNDLLEACEVVSEGVIAHPDKLLVDAEGRVYAGDDGGRIHRLVPDGAGGYDHQVVAAPGGRPMQLAFTPAGDLLVADLFGSHFSIDSSGNAVRLPTLDDVPQGTAGVAVASDGLVYYGAHTDPLPGTEQTGALLVGLEAPGSSELRVYDPRTRRVTTLVRGLYLPVGVTLSADEDFVAVAEFYGYRVTRYWLKGPKRGTHDRLIDNLPGFPDGLASDGSGTLYISFAGLRNPLLDRMHPHPRIKDQFAKLMVLLMAVGTQPAPGPGVVLAVDESGRMLRSFHDPEGRRVRQLTAAEPHAGQLFVASIGGDWIARCPIGSPPPP